MRRAEITARGVHARAKRPGRPGFHDLVTLDALTTAIYSGCSHVFNSQRMPLLGSAPVWPDRYAIRGGRGPRSTRVRLVR